MYEEILSGGVALAIIHDTWKRRSPFEDFAFVCIVHAQGIRGIIHQLSYLVCKFGGDFSYENSKSKRS
ncbi:hypothetical protein BK699_30620 [Bacillus thuringiensis serovar mexicanensis]|uniref:Uncharacterized protein n=1 Tax=Bacillus thuringiensis serovar mexicanensis TaxID=180868 RepID=A0A242W0D3_BACTU|nr:hypothetical protein BK699_30620 [Bacillus thuringiensis serovar mexicanensis]OTW98696.1 hypothetical protein BK705_22745 [Bacillus thuringiensis serovar monterrey]